MNISVQRQEDEMTTPDNIKEEIEKEAQDWAKELYPMSAWVKSVNAKENMNLRYLARKQIEETATRFATKFFERGFQIGQSKPTPIGENMYVVTAPIEGIVGGIVRDIMLSDDFNEVLEAIEEEEQK